MSTPAPPRAGGPVRPGGPVPAGPRPAGPTPALPTTQRPRTAPPRRGGLSRTPGKLRLAMALAILASLLIGAIGLIGGLRQSALLGAASERTDQIVSLLDARGSLVSADSTATNAFLVGGLEPAALRADYDAALHAGAVDLTLLAGRAVDSTGRLGDASGALASYAGLVEQARANNRQGFPVGAAYLDQASRTLASDVLVPIDIVVVETADASAAAFNTVRGMAGLGVVMLLGLGVLIGIQVWLARRTRRVLNPPMVAGTLVAGIAAVVGMVSFTSAANQATEVREGSYRATLATSQALSLVGEARSDEAFALIRRGNGASYEESFAVAVEQARADLERASTASPTRVVPDPLTLLDEWVAAHAEIRALDDGGDWDGAVALATSLDPDAPSARYTAFVEAATEQVAADSASTRTALGSARIGGALTGWTIAIAAVLCAVLSWRGLARRLEEYR